MPNSSNKLQVFRQASLRERNSFGLSACARELAVLRSLDQLPQVEQWLDGRRPFILGGGSNLLLTADIEAPVLAIELTLPLCIEATSADSALVQAAAGMNWHELVQLSLREGWAGLENLALIPGSVGASPVQNIGAYGVELADRLDSVIAWNWQTGEQAKMSLADCALRYRHSWFKTPAGQAWVILSVSLRLHRFGARPLDLQYGDIRAQLERQKIDQPNAADVGRVVSQIRASKLPDPKKLGNAGSFFKNPMVSAQQAQALLVRFPDMPQFTAENVHERKLSAAWLIDRCGWKGFRDGDAGVHTHHALVLVNYGAASGTQLLSLARRIRDSVQQTFDVALEAEPCIVPQPL